MEISELFVFLSFGKVLFFEVRKFFGIKDFFSNLWKLCTKKFGKKFENNFLFLSPKTLFLCQKVRKKFGNRVFQTFGIYGNLRNCSILNFPNIKKNYVKLELWKSRKTCSNSKTDLKARLKVRNAGPYFYQSIQYSTRNWLKSCL